MAFRPVFVCQDMRVSRGAGEGESVIISGLNLSLRRGECVALWGPSGSGKTTALLAPFGLLPPGLRVSADATLQGSAARSAVGRRGTGGVAFVLQSPAENFSPYFNIGLQLSDSKVFSETRAQADWYADLGFSTVERLMGQRPEQCSGGELQRLALVAALLKQPALLVADEPTAALDARLRDGWCRVVRRECERGMAVLVATHDEAVVCQLSARRLELRAAYPMATSSTGRHFQVPPPGHPLLVQVSAEGQNFSLLPGGCLSLWGPSGCGKSSLLHLVAGLPTPLRGTVQWNDAPPRNARGAMPRVGVVLQHARQGLNPYRSIRDTICSALRRSGHLAKDCLELSANELAAAGIPEGCWDCRPAELSAGQAQRAALAQAVAIRPALLVCDEPTSAQDSVHRALVAKRLTEMRQRCGTAVLLATHDAALVDALGADLLALSETAPAGRVGEAVIITA